MTDENNTPRGSKYQSEVNGKKTYIYWSPFTQFKKCPQYFLWRKGWPGIDLGYGDGKAIPITEFKCGAAAMMGNIASDFIEKFYKDKVYLEGAKAAYILKEFASIKLEQGIAKTTIDWTRVGNKVELYIQLEKYVDSFLDTVKDQKLLGNVSSTSEVTLSADITSDLTICSRYDISIENHDGILLLDAKTSKDKSYVDKDQLQWEALCMYSSLGNYPKKLGWLWLRYPKGEMYKKKEVTCGVDWEDVNLRKIAVLVEDVKKMQEALLQKKFEPTPSSNSCRFCEYTSICDAYKEKKSKATPRAKKSGLDLTKLTDLSIFNLDDI